MTHYCTACKKKHTHSHVRFMDGTEAYGECYECCTHTGCVDAKKRGLVQSKDGKGLVNPGDA